MLRLQVPCNSSHMVESKSLKLYLSSFAQTRFTNRSEIINTIDSDLSVAFRSPVIVAMLDVDHGRERTALLPGRCIDEIDVSIDTYVHDPNLIQLDFGDAIIRETLHSHLFRSVCPVTGQPDSASILIQYVGRPLRADSVLRYLVSYRLHAAFHESAIEQIFVDLMRRARPDHLTVYGRFLRRGGIDINPFRTSESTWRGRSAPDVRQ